MAAPTKPRATYQDVIDSPEHMVAEVVGGALRLSNRPGGPATAVGTRLGRLLGSHFDDGGGGWLILWEPELHLGDEIVVPDLAGWRAERMPPLSGAFFTQPPDWTCEVLSKSTERFDRSDKMPLYGAHGVEYAWLVDPRKRTLEAYRLSEGAWAAVAVHRDDDRVRIKPFEAIEIDLARLWVGIPLPTRLSEPAAQYEYRSGSIDPDSTTMLR